MQENNSRIMIEELEKNTEKEREHPDVDVRKMIIYSELLKPKFDEGLN